MIKKKLKAKKNNRRKGNSTDKTKYWFSVNDLISIYGRKKIGDKRKLFANIYFDFCGIPSAKVLFY